MSRVHINELFAQTASKAKKMRYFYSLFSENLRFTQNLPNEVFLTISDFKVDIPYKKTLRITLACQEQSFLVSFITDKNCTIISKKHQAYGTKSINFIKEHFDLGNFGIGFAEFKAKLLVTNFCIYHI